MDAIGNYLMQIARLHQAAGDVAAALATLDAAIASAERSGERVLLSPLHRQRSGLLGFISAREFDVAAALRCALDIARSQGAGGFARQAKAALEPPHGVVSPAML